jgi:hypothetical protein
MMQESIERLFKFQKAGIYFRFGVPLALPHFEAIFRSHTRRPASRFSPSTC